MYTSFISITTDQAAEDSQVFYTTGWPQIHMCSQHVTRKLRRCWYTRTDRKGKAVSLLVILIACHQSWLIVLKLRSKCSIYMQSNKIHKVILTGQFYSSHMLARHVSDLIGPSSGAFCTSCICRLWYVVIRVLLDTSSRYEVLPTTS